MKQNTHDILSQSEAEANASAAKSDDQLVQFVRDSDRNIRNLYFLHLAISMLLIFLTLFLLSCSKAEEKIDDGPAVPVEQKDDAMAMTIGEKTLVDIKKGEWMAAMFTQRVFTGPFEVTATTSKKASERLLHNDEIWLKAITQEIQYLKTGKDVNTYIDEYCLKSNPPRFCRPDEETSSLVSPQSLGLTVIGENKSEYKPNSIQLKNGLGYEGCRRFTAHLQFPPGYSISYHNLRTSNTVEPAPELVQKSPNCGGLANCQMNVRTVEYDEILWSDIGGRERFHCLFKFSDDVPVLANMLEYCKDFLYTSDNKKIPVQLCAKVMNFTR